MLTGSCARTARLRIRFTWSDPEETRTPQQMLEAEGISFDAANRADPAKRLSVPELQALSA